MSASFRERNRRRRENRKEKEIIKEEIEGLMKPSATYFLTDLEEGSGAAVAMDVDDDNNPLELMGEGGVGGFLDTKLVDADFFNSFEDDFDDSDIN